MKKSKGPRIPLVAWRDGRPRYVPSATARARGEKGQDLKHPSGSWFTYEQAQEWSQEKRAALQASSHAVEAERAPAAPAGPARGTLPAAPRRPATGRSGRTLAHIVTDFTDKNPRMLGKDIVEGRKVRPALAPKTAQYYRDAASLVRRLDDGGFWARPAEAWQPETIALLLDRAEVCHGLAQARAVRAMLSQAFANEVKLRFLKANPMRFLEERLPVLPPRVRYGSVEEVRHLVAAADLVGRPEVGDMVLQGVWTGQRQADRLSLTHAQLRDLTLAFRQAKKGGQPLEIPVARLLEKRLAATARRRQLREDALRSAGKPVVVWPHVNLDEKAGRPFKSKHYQHVYREVANAAAWGLWRVPAEDGGPPVLATVVPAGRPAPRHIGTLALARLPARGAVEVLPPMPSLLDLRDQDLRDTAVTWLARAGADKMEIASITGHSLKTIDQILQHYFGLHPDLAKRAIGKLEDWYMGAEG
ncbi:hypothetical protein [Stappia indica]|uniref:hypothetical protein n=1 Tax=Stappia indica TaxID=538381 RepID=UPI00082A4806|nr:hypothetical protein [Stappia indica]